MSSQQQNKNQQSGKKGGNTAEYELYKRLKLLGEGSFGKAYLVECLQDKSKWVIKQMSMNAMTQEEKRQTFKEAKILEALSHPNIVQFKEVYKTKKGKLCIVMEYADGGDLQAKIKEANGKLFQESQILDWFTQICLALKHVHDRKIVHRDLKGQNVFLTKDDRIKLGDFGIARVLTKTFEKCKTMVGTPYYLSPEIIENRPYSFESDIWSLGVILYEMCAQQPPFTADSIHFLALRIVRGSFKPIPGKYSKGLNKLIESMLNIDPQKRPNVHEILKSHVIQNRIKEFLTETVKQREFDHTILHNQQVHISKADDQYNNLKMVNRELPMPPQLLKVYKKEEQKKMDAQMEKNNQNKLPALPQLNNNGFNNNNRNNNIEKQQQQQYPFIPQQQQLQQPPVIRDIQTAQQQQRKGKINQFDNNNIAVAQQRNIQTPQANAFKKKPSNNNFNNQLYEENNNNNNNNNNNYYNNKNNKNSNNNNNKNNFHENPFFQEEEKIEKIEELKKPLNFVERKQNEWKVSKPQTPSQNMRKPVLIEKKNSEQQQQKVNNINNDQEVRQQKNSNSNISNGQKQQNFIKRQQSNPNILQRQDSKQSLKTEESVSENSNNNNNNNNNNKLPDKAKIRLNEIKKKNSEDARSQLTTAQENLRKRNQYGQQVKQVNNQLRQQQQNNNSNVNDNNNKYQNNRNVNKQQLNNNNENQIKLQQKNQERIQNRQKMLEDIDQKRKTIKSQGGSILEQDMLNQQQTPKQNYSGQNSKNGSKNPSYQELQQQQQNDDSISTAQTPSNNNKIQMQKKQYSNVTEESPMNTNNNNNIQQENNSNQNFYQFKPQSQQQLVRQQQQQQQKKNQSNQNLHSPTKKQQQQQQQYQFTDEKCQQLQQGNGNNNNNNSNGNTGKSNQDDPFGLARPKTSHRKKMEQQQQQYQQQLQQQQQQQILLQQQNSQPISGNSGGGANHNNLNNNQGFQQIYDADKNIEDLMQAQQQAQQQLNPNQNFTNMMQELKGLIEGVNNAVDNIPQQFSKYDENKNYFGDDTSILQPEQLEAILQSKQKIQDHNEQELKQLIYTLQQQKQQQQNEVAQKEVIQGNQQKKQQLPQQQYKQQQQPDENEQQQQKYIEEMPSEIQEQQYEDEEYEDDRDDDDDEPEENQVNNNDDSNLQELTKEQEESFTYMEQDCKKLQSLRNLLSNVMGQSNFEKAFEIIQKEVQKFSDISEIEKKHRKDNYKNLLPFLSEDIIKKYIALIITLVIMEEKQR